MAVTVVDFSKNLSFEERLTRIRRFIAAAQLESTLIVVPTGSLDDPRVILSGPDERELIRLKKIAAA